MHVHTALQHASDTVSASLYVAMHFARCNVAVVSRIFQKYQHAVACAVREGCTGISQQFLERQFLHDDCPELLQELRVVLSPLPHITESSSELLQPSSPAKQSIQPSSPARSAVGVRARGDSNAVLQAARSLNLPLVASISGGSSAALTGAVKSAVETNDTVALTVLLSSATVTGSPRCMSRCNHHALSVTPPLSFCSGSPTLAPGCAPDEKQKTAAPAAPGSVVSALEDDEGAAESLLAAVVNGDIASARVLVRHGVASSCRNSLMATPLAVACEAGLRDMVQLLLDVCRPSVSTFDVNLRRPLHLAALSKSKDIVELLVAAGANVHDTDVNGNTALHFATLCNATGCMQVLLQSGSDVRAQNKDGSTTLHLLQGVAAAKVLLEDGQHKHALTVLDSRGRNVLLVAALNGDAELLGLLLDLNVTFGSPLSLLHTDDEGSSVLHNACKPSVGRNVDKDAENLAMQILKFVDESMQQQLCNLTDVNHMTPLHLACINGQLSSCKALLLAGADPLLSDKDGMMPLSYACLHSHRRVGDYIMSMVPKLELPTIPDNEGISVMSKRRSTDHSDSRDSNSRTSRDIAQELGEGDESPKRNAAQQKDSRWVEGSGPEVIIALAAARCLFA